MSCLLKLDNVSKRFDDFNLGPISLDIASDELVGLVGKNGAGKTTLMKLIFGVVRPSAGSIELFGHNIAEVHEQELVELRQHIGLVSDVVAYPQAMTVADIKQLYTLSYPLFLPERFDELCHQMGLDAHDKRVSDLSRGMGMKLQLAAVLACGADLLVMDEPTAGLDPIVRDEVLTTIRSWMEEPGHAALISSHISSDLERLADRILFIDDGKLVLEATADEIAAMGVAVLRSSELEHVMSDAYFAPGEAHVLKGELSYELLVPSRQDFSAAYPSYACERAGIDKIMLLILKGEAR